MSCVLILTILAPKNALVKENIVEKKVKDDGKINIVRNDLVKPEIKAELPVKAASDKPPGEDLKLVFHKVDIGKYDLLYKGNFENKLSPKHGKQEIKVNPFQKHVSIVLFYIIYILQKDNPIGPEVIGKVQNDGKKAPYILFNPEKPAVVNKGIRSFVYSLKISS